MLSFTSDRARTYCCTGIPFECSWFVPDTDVLFFVSDILDEIFSCIVEVTTKPEICKIFSTNIFFLYEDFLSRRRFIFSEKNFLTQRPSPHTRKIPHFRHYGVFLIKFKFVGFLFVQFLGRSIFVSLICLPRKWPSVCDEFRQKRQKRKKN